MSDYFLCCFYYNQRQSNTRHGNSGKFPLRSIDKSMIGLPTNFQHCAHIGCSDLSPGSNSNSASNNAIDLTANGLISQHRINPNDSQSINNRNQYIHQQQPILTHMKLIDLKSS